ncbi:MAG: FG-GAP repeat domain-containing protein, partial [Planctomycetota bacterium]
TTILYTNAMLGGLLSNPVDVKVGEITREGAVDIVILNAGNGAPGNQSVVVLRNLGAQNFTASSFATNALPNFAGLQAVSIDIRDVNQDGVQDIAVLGSSTVAATTNGVGVFLNNTPAGGGAPVLVAGPFSALPATDVGAIKLQFVANPDLNGDGRPDLLCLSTTSGTITALSGAAGGAFGVLSTISVGGSGPVAFATADVDESGSLDIVTANQGSSTVSVILTNGAGALSLFTTVGVPFVGTANFRDVVIGDVNYDCRNDIVVTSFNGTNLALFLGNGDGSFGTPTNYTAESPGLAGTANVLAIAKIEGSSGIDAILCVDAQTPGSVGSFLTLVPRHVLSLYFGDFAGSPPNPLFSTTTQGIQPQDVSFGDLNGDARLDFVLVNRVSNNVQVFLGDGTGKFTEPFPPIPLKASAQPEGVLIAKVDNTSDAPSVLVACNGANQIALLRNFGGGSLANPTFINVDGSGPHQVLVEDMNDDGKLDLITVNQLSNNVTILLGDGLGSFARATSSPYPVGNGPLAGKIADVNADNVKDIVVANFAGDNVTILRQVGSTATNVTFSASTVALGGNIPTNSATPPFALPRSTVEPRSIAVGDLNNDGIPDLVTADGFTGTLTILHGKARGRLSLLNASAAILVGDTLSTEDRYFAGSSTVRAPYRCVVTSIVTAGTGVGSTGVYTVNAIQGGTDSAVGLNQQVAGAFFGNDTMDIERAGANLGAAGNVQAIDGIRASGEFFQPTDYFCESTPTSVGSPPVVFSAGTTPTVVKLFDMNTDGFLDIIVGDGSTSSISVFINQSDANRLLNGTLGGLRQKIFSLVVLPPEFLSTSPAGEFSFKADDTLPDFAPGVVPHNGYPIRSFKAPKVAAGGDVKFTASVSGRILSFDIGNVTLDCPPSVVVVTDDNRVTVLKCN